MRKNNIYAIIVGVLILQFFSCQPNSTLELKKALTFYVSFDNETTADFALGDANIYTANGSYEEGKRILDSIQTGMTSPNHRIVEGKGLFGNALEFGKERSRQVLFYKSKDNVSYNPQNWSGAISFWLSVNPSTDLKGYTDPIQITDVNFNDASIWVDFTDDKPPHFRLGVIGDKNEWALDTLNTPADTVWDKRIINVEKPAFSRKSWTHVLITYKELGTSNSESKLYLNGVKMGSINGIDDPFTWDIEKSNIYLGLGFTGLMDELSIFNKPLTEEEVKRLHELKGGVKSIL